MCTFLSKKRKLIPSKILQNYNARLVDIRKDQILFHEGDKANEYFQVETGQVRMFILNEEGQEFIQGIFNKGESFGEPPLLGNFSYPSSAIVNEPGTLWRLPKLNFIQLLKDHFEIHLKMDEILCNRLQYKSMILTEISAHPPEHRLQTVLTYLKSKMNASQQKETIIPFTRQQLADMTGLRVETVIRTIKKMEQKGKLSLDGHKIKL